MAVKAEQTLIILRDKMEQEQGHVILFVIVWLSLSSCLHFVCLRVNVMTESW